MKEFYYYITRKENVVLLCFALGIGVIYFIVLRILFPIPSFYFDSYTYIQVARDKSAVSFRPVVYAMFINFFKRFSTSDIALIAGQYFSNVFANLFLFFTFTWFFTFNKIFRLIFFVLVICNPVYLFYSNYILTDSFFSAFTVLWFTLLVWIMYKPSWYLNLIQLLLLALLFQLRYNAIIFPVFTALAFLLSRQELWKKLINISAGFILIFLLVITTIKKTKDYTGTKTFSAFSGWQLANNALHVLGFETLDASGINDAETKRIISFSKKYFDTTKFLFDATSVTADYMWNRKSPLKAFMSDFALRHSKANYLSTWIALGPVYSKFGQTVIFNKPFSYCKYFVWPNIKQFFIPELEAYNSYCENLDTISPIAKAFFGYKDNKVGAKHPWVYTLVFKPWKVVFPVLNFFFLVLALIYLAKKMYKKDFGFFNLVLICLGAFYLANFFFVVLLAPTVFRYHVFIITLLFPIVLLLLQCLTARKTIRDGERDGMNSGGD